MTFPRIYMEKFWQIFFFQVHAVNYCWSHHFLTKVILGKLKILYILMQWLKRFIFWNIFLEHCKIIISYLELFLATYFLCILQTQLVFWYYFLFWIYFSLCMQVMMYSHFPVREDNKNAVKIKLLIESVKYT